MGDLAPYLPGFFAAYAILIVAASSPGPAVAMLLGIGLGQGRWAAMIATAGIAVGSLTLNALTLLGVSVILREAAWVMGIMRVLGAAYLLWLAYCAFRKALSGAEVELKKTKPRSGPQLFAMGYLLQVTNPKAIVFWLAIASVGATQGAGIGVIALFVLGALFISFVCHAAWALLLSSAVVRAGYGRIRRPVEAVLGSLFAFFAFRLVTERG
ncbi:MAG: LysE family translocator [Pseudomonadota bacterium]